MTTCIVPDSWYWKCGASQLFVFTIGFREVDQRHPGWNTARPTVAPPIFTRSSLPFSKVLVSSGVPKLLTSIFAKQNYLCAVEMRSARYNSFYPRKAVG